MILQTFAELLMIILINCKESEEKDRRSFSSTVKSLNIEPKGGAMMGSILRKFNTVKSLSIEPRCIELAPKIELIFGPLDNKKHCLSLRYIELSHY